MSRKDPSLRANFDVGVLFYNRARQTLECILSFLNDEVRPNIVVLDQGSAAEQRKLLDDTLAFHPSVRFITLAENLGVAAGRNRLCRECTANWILFVDNDVTLGTYGGVALIDDAVAHADDIEGLVPRLLNVHENCFLERKRLVRVGGRVQVETVDLGVVPNMFVGGAVILRRSVLLESPYDERYFVGLEDLDLALSAFNGGRPLRLRTLDEVILARKHMPVATSPDVASKRMRDEALLTARGFDVLKGTHGGALRGESEAWADNRRQEAIAGRQIAAQAADKINVTYVVDVPNWAFDNTVRNLRLHMGERYALTIAYAQDDVGRLLQRVLESRPDIIHFMWRAEIRRLVGAAEVRRCAALMGLPETDILDRLCQSHITFSVADDLFLSEEDTHAFRPLFWLADGYCVISPAQLHTYERIVGYPRPTALIMNGVDRSLYRPAGPGSRKNSHLTVGWVGNSSWGEDHGLVDAKGLKTIIRPSIEALRDEGIDVELLAVDRVERWRTREEVAALYREMDVYLCASSAEGAPNTVLEAMASGIPVVATRVGIVPILFGPLQQNFIVERSIEAFSDALRRLSSDEDLRKRLAEENLRQIAEHDWSRRAPEWQQLFAEVIRRAHPDAPQWRRLMIDRFFLGAGESAVPALPQITKKERLRDRFMKGRAAHLARLLRAWARNSMET